MRWRRNPTGQTPDRGQSLDEQGPTPVGGLSQPLPQGSPQEWEYIPEGWSYPTRGWDAEAVADAYARKWQDYLAAIEAPKPLGVHHETAEVLTGDAGAHNMLVTFAYVLALSARGRDRLSVLDWGGGFGHYHALARSVLPGLDLDWHVKETTPVAARGRELNREVTFHDDDLVLDRRYDLVVASSSLQYAEDWQSLLGRLAEAAERYLYVARVPVALGAPSFVVVQRPYVHGYDTEYLGWVLNRDELLAAAPPLTREFLLDARFSAAGAPEDPVDHRSFLFNR
jgi:putative methyltransferase (TIGR04325 family)